jgi:hypothetical protein
MVSDTVVMTDGAFFDREDPPCCSNRRAAEALASSLAWL